MLNMDAPLAKVPFLLLNTVSMYYGMKPPRPPPPSKEIERFGGFDLLSATKEVQLKLAMMLRAGLGALSLAEVAVILAEHFPSPLSNKILALLTPAALRMTPVFLAGSVLTAMGGLIRIYCHHTLGKYFTWQVSLQEDHELVTAGPYSVVRHPSYTGWALLAAGKVMVLFGRGSYFAESGMMNTWKGKAAAGALLGYMLFVTFSLFARVEKEDAVLSREFGQEWSAWTKKTPYKLFPYLY